jgi:hypothetical protein
MQIPPVHSLVASLIELVHLFFDFFRRERKGRNVERRARGQEDDGGRWRYFGLKKK